LLGEINRSIIQSYSNKAHYGYLGDSIVGEWVNLGAGTTTSNLKLTYGDVSTYDLPSNTTVNSNSQFLGTIFGDFVKTGIQSSFDCGTIIGSFCSLYGQKPHHKFVPPFTWGEPDDYRSQNIESMINSIERMMKRRNKALSDAQKVVLNTLYKQGQSYQTISPKKKTTKATKSMTELPLT